MLNNFNVSLCNQSFIFRISKHEWILDGLSTIIAIVDDKPVHDLKSICSIVLIADILWSNVDVVYKLDPLIPVDELFLATIIIIIVRCAVSCQCKLPT